MTTRLSVFFAKREHKMAAAYTGAILCLLAVSLFAGIVHFNLDKEERSRIAFDSFYVQKPAGIGKVKITDSKGNAVLYAGGKEAGGVGMYDYYRYDTDGLRLPKDAKQIGRRSYLETENKMHMIELRLRTTDANGKAITATHVFLTTDIYSKVYDFYEIDGAAPEGGAVDMAYSIRWQIHKPTLGEGWKTAKIKMSLVKKDQKASDEGEKVASIDPIPAARAYLPSIKGCSIEDIYCDYSYVIPDTGDKPESYTVTFIRKDNSAVDVTVNQPLKQDDTGVWAATAYRIYSPDSLSPVIANMNYEQIKTNAAYVVYGGGGITACGHTKADTFVAAMENGTPCQVDLMTCTDYQNKITIYRWLRLVYNGSIAIKYSCYKTYDGTYRCYNPVEFTDISVRTGGGGLIGYTIGIANTSTTNGTKKTVFIAQDITG